MKVSLIFCAAVGAWMALIALANAFRGDWTLALIFVVLALLNANSVAALYRRLP